MARARVKIGMANMVCSIKRRVFLDRPATARGAKDGEIAARSHRPSDIDAKARFDPSCPRPSLQPRAESASIEPSGFIAFIDPALGCERDGDGKTRNQPRNSKERRS
jgi:hypothetical protein